tara:strand:- start:426 stop:671 length:246 start_codon:yes stop_codon:yes gene_type:complete
MENKSSEHFIKNTSLNKLSKRAGVKTLSNNSYPIIHDILTNKMIEITNIIKSVNTENGTKNIMLKDLETTFEIMGINIILK